MAGRPLRALVIKKLQSRGPIDVPSRYPIRPGIVATVFTLLGLFLLVTVLAEAGELATRYAVVLALGIGSFVVIFAILAIAGKRADL